MFCPRSPFVHTKDHGWLLLATCDRVLRQDPRATIDFRAGEMELKCGAANSSASQGKTVRRDCKEDGMSSRHPKETPRPNGPRKCEAVPKMSTEK